MITFHSFFMAAVQAIIKDSPHMFITYPAERARPIFEVVKDALETTHDLPEPQYQNMLRAVSALIDRKPTARALYIEGEHKGMVVGEFTEDGQPLQFIAFVREPT